MEINSPMFFDVWKAYKEACGIKGPWLEHRIDILQELERRIRGSGRKQVNA